VEHGGLQVQSGRKVSCVVYAVVIVEDDDNAVAVGVMLSSNLVWRIVSLTNPNCCCCCCC